MIPHLPAYHTIERETRKTIGFSILVFALLFVSVVPFFSYATVPPLKEWGVWEASESFVYQASWNGIPVATAKINAEPVWWEGKKSYRVRIKARTWKYLDPIWKMRDSIESIFSGENFQTRRFTFLQKENRKRTYTLALYDPGTETWTVRREKKRKVKWFEFVSDDTLDPISAFYRVRSLDIKVGDRLRLNVFGGKSRYRVTLEVVAKERISVQTGSFEAYKIISKIINISRKGYAQRVREATVWISANRNRTPLRIVSKVFIGSVTIDLVKVNRSAYRS